MLDLREYARRPASLCDYLPWAALVAPGVVLNKDGAFQRTAAFRGPDLEAAADTEAAAVAARVNSVLRRLGSGWALFVEARRDPAMTYPDSAFPDPVSALVDCERRAAFLHEGAHYESRYYLTLVYQPPAERDERLAGLLIEGRTRALRDWRAELAGFVERTDRLLAQVAAIMPTAVWLDDAQTLSFLHGAVSTERQGVSSPATPMHLDALLATQPLSGGLEPRLGTSHLRVLTLTGFPPATTPGILDELDRLAFAYRWTSRAIFLDKTQAQGLLARIRRQWFSKRKSVLALLQEALTQQPAALVDNDAANKAGDADLALQDLGDDTVAYAYVTTSLVVWDEDPAKAEAKLSLAEKVIAGRDFTVIREWVGAVEAWLGSLPGQVYANVRQPPLSTLNFAHMAPLSAAWAGPQRNVHLGGPPLLMARTQGATPFRLSLHVGDVGHTVVVGPTGAGKSTLLALMALQFRRYRGARVFAFDFGASIRAAVLGMGGAFHDLGGVLREGDRPAVALQPLAMIDQESERIWAAGWVEAILLGEGVAITPGVRELVWSALVSLAGAEARDRTLTGLCALLASRELKQALAPYCLGGSFGRLLDADQETLGEGAIEAFETEGLLGAGAAPAVLAYLFHRIERRLDGAPTLILVDEAWLALADEAFGAQLQTWLGTVRKKNGSVVLTTLSLVQIEQSPIAAAIIELCLTRIFLPNASALDPVGAAAYRRFGLGERQIELVGRAVPKQDYYVQSRDGERLFELGLGPVALAFAGAAAKADQAAMNEILAEHPPGDFAAVWLRRGGLGWAADLLADLKLQEP